MRVPAKARPTRESGQPSSHRETVGMPACSSIETWELPCLWVHGLFYSAEDPTQGSLRMMARGVSLT